MEGNTSTSLLKLPREIRNTIWRDLLGDRTVHIHYNPVDVFVPYYGPPEDKPVGKSETGERFEYAVCVAANSNEAAHAMFIESSYKSPQDPRLADHRHSPCHARHKHLVHYQHPHKLPACWCVHNNDEGLRANQLEMQALLVCRQFYAELTPILYGTNTFSFTSSASFTKVMQARTPPQRALMKRLHLDINLGKYGSSFVVLERWQTALNKRLLRQFRSIDTLHLDLLGNQISGIKVEWPRAGPVSSCNMNMDELKDLNYLPLKNVTVICSYMRSQPEPGHIADGWVHMSHGEHVEMAEKLRTRFLDYQGKNEQDQVGKVELPVEEDSTESDLLTRRLELLESVARRAAADRQREA